jgi:hypothetical protein
MRRVAVVLCALVACSAPAMPTTVPPPLRTPGGDSVILVPPPPPAGPPTGKLRFGPAAARYVVRQHVRMEHNRADMPPVTQLGWRTYVAGTITGPADSTGYPASFTIDSIVPDSGVMLPPWMDVATARGLRFFGYLSPTGEFVQGRASDSAASEKLAKLIGRFRQFYPRIPRDGVAPGDSWTDTLTLVDSAGGSTTVRESVRRVSAHGWEDTPAGRALRLDVSEQYKYAESGAGGGQAIQAQGTGVAASVERIGASGRYLGTVSLDSAQLVITLPAQGITIPRRQITTITVTVLP